ncbi:uncharacterized protein LOC113202965 isoform X2 [Frankliniella occidentalis]|uniref:Uncharacterized protein LOC113202965 isoform X2 n=1 Tax=Frankliniella occidentalis TaxID=133901 RepID=A0A9C6U2A1_FRAOC|nr:uncharacterized protein LOC113202965 isoform X2 [Frankliniella occidentalis]
MHQVQILDRVKSDRVAVTQPEEDRRRRTIIVEKTAGTYGFTLQSYGIHYKKEQEIEMITYVDFVDYDGPAYRAGMREGDVILSINGHDMEKTDHKTLVNFIKNCDSRMRMVVLFEDCVRKVELHMRYIQVQRALRNKMLELERLCLKERELLEGKWKTHSLPARKKATSSASSTERSFHQEPTTEYSYCRPTVSTEDVASIQPQVVLAYQYMEPQYRAYLLQGQSIASTVGSTNSADYLLSWNSQQTSLQQPHQHQIVVKSCLRGCRQVNGATSVPVPTEEPFTPNSHQHSAKVQSSTQKHRHLCAPCIRPNNQGDNGSLDAYDLASPCCDSRCVPTRRKSSHKQSSDGKDKGSKENRWGSSGRSSHQHSHQQQHQYHQQPHHQNQQQPHSHRYMSLGGASTTNGTVSSGGSSHSQVAASGLVSQCSLHSCASNWSEHAATASNATSLSTDTLYWDDSMHSALTHTQLSQNANLETYATTYHIYNPVKPKSCDNLTTKGMGGYGFGYGYLENTSQRSGSQKEHSNRGYKMQPTGCLEDSCGRQYYIVTGPLVSKSSAENLLCRTDSSHSCDCLDAASTSSNRRIITADKPPKQAHHHHKNVTYEIHPLPQKQVNQQSQPNQEKQQQQQQQSQQAQALRDMASQTDSKSAQGEVTRL